MIWLALAFVVGLGAGVWLSFLGLDFWAHSEAGRRWLALQRAEARVRDAQTEALNRLADVAGEAVYDASGVPSNRRWPSESVTPGADIEARVAKP